MYQYISTPIYTNVYQQQQERICNVPLWVQHVRFQHGRHNARARGGWVGVHGTNQQFQLTVDPFDLTQQQQTTRKSECQKVSVVESRRTRTRSRNNHSWHNHYHHHVPSSSSLQIKLKQPTRSLYNPKFLLNDCVVMTGWPSSTKVRTAVASFSASPDAKPW